MEKLKNIKKYWLFIIVLVCMGFVLTACQREQKHKQGYSVITITEKSTTNILYYQGTMAPIATTPVSSPTDGVVDKMLYSYGSHIEKGQVLYSIKPTDQKSDFASGLTDYLKAKQDFDTNNEKLQSSNELYKRGLISRDDYEQTQNAFYVSRLSFMQAQDAFDKVLQLHDIQLQNLGSLKLGDIDAIKAAIAKQKGSEGIKVISPDFGIALFPKESGGNDSDRVQVGTQVKQGQVLVNLGDMNGIAIKIQINELDINNIQVNQKAEISSDVLPNFRVEAYVKNVDSQATSSGNLPMFSAVVIGTNLTAEQQKLVKVGMSAKVAIMLQGKPQISVPINAVFRQNSQYVVKVVNKTTGKFSFVPVITGQTTPTSVVIIAGLQAGDQIVVPN
jgi:HlyD family secretion protein